ncbi:MAG: glycoside hydrolase family 19 protein [Syntrophobacter sp.]
MNPNEQEALLLMTESPTEHPISPNREKTTSAITTRGARLLTEAVGYRCPNQREDVETVQRLLNLNGSRFGMPQPLKPDGAFGEKTLDALRAFQEIVLSLSGPGCMIQPGDMTLQSLCGEIPDSFGETILAFIFLHANEIAIEGMAHPIAETMARYGIDTPPRQAHFLAQIGHESGELHFREELADGTAYERRRDLGNTQRGDGPRFKGRGLIQLTGRSNYTHYREACRVDVLERPELVATDDRLCTDVAGWFWDRHKLNAHADRDDLEKITRVINGGLNGIENRRRLLNRARALLGG